MRWGVLGVLIVAAIFRMGMSWYNGADLKAGNVVKIRETVGYNLTTKWGRRFLTVKNGLGRGEIEIEIPEAKKLSFGDKVEISGSLKPRMIDKNDKRFTLVISHLFISPGTRKLGRILYDLRGEFEGRIRRSISGDEGELLAGIVLGDTGKMSRQATEGFRRVGLAHVVAASGYNVGVIAGWILAVGLLIAHRKVVMLFAILCIGLYMLLAGMQPAVVRAGVMGIMGLGGLILGRKTDGGWALAISVLMMLVINPMWATDIGFQLSAASMAGVLTIQQPLIDWLRWRLPKFAAEGVGATIAAMIFTQPLIWHYFGTLSIAAPLVNGLVIWMVPLIMEIGAVGLVVGSVWEELGQVVLWGAWPILKAFMAVSGWVGRMSWASWQTNNVGWAGVAGYYGLLLVLYWRVSLKKSREVSR